MYSIKLAALAASFLLGYGGLASAQDAMATHDMSAMGSSAVPDVCVTDAGKSVADKMPAMGLGHTMDVDEGHMALMQGMDAMNKDMMTGAMAPDIDVAFVCGMIPHHQGAISMAKAELQYGDNEWAKEMAQKVIDAQEQEIADMIAWLKEQPK